MTEVGTAKTVLVHLASGIGNILLATPLLLTLHRHGYIIDLLVDGDYPETAELFDGWPILRTVYNGRKRDRPAGIYDVRIAAIPPFYWSRYAAYYNRLAGCIARPSDALFYRNEQDYYLEFARTLGLRPEATLYYHLPPPQGDRFGIGADTIVLAPGCKTGEMSAKRWPHFVELANQLNNVAVVGTADDLQNWNGTKMRFGSHCRVLAGELTLRETASALAAAGVVVANDSGLGHLAGALGAPTVMLFGPTPNTALGQLPPNLTVLRAGLPCEPCWFSGRFASCRRRIDCLSQLTIEKVMAAMWDAQRERAGGISTRGASAAFSHQTINVG